MFQNALLNLCRHPDAQPKPSKNANTGSARNPAERKIETKLHKAANSCALLTQLVLIVLPAVVQLIT
jgi:hypothetical protein